MTAQDIIALLTPVVGPLLTAGVKKVLPKIPTWLIPVLATALGAGFNLLTNYATSHQISNVWAAAALGLAGIGVREIKDQLTPDASDFTKPPETPKTP